MISGAKYTIHEVKVLIRFDAFFIHEKNIGSVSKNLCKLSSSLRKQRSVTFGRTNQKCLKLSSAFKLAFSKTISLPNRLLKYKMDRLGGRMMIKKMKKKESILH